MQDVNAAEFEKEVLQSKPPVLVDFWANWCAPCKAIAPVLSKLADKYADTLKVAKVNIEDSEDLAQDLNIRSIPAILFFKDGKEVARLVGAGDIEKRIEEALHTIVFKE